MTERLHLVAAAIAVLLAVLVATSDDASTRPVDPYNPANAVPYRQEP